MALVAFYAAHHLVLRLRLGDGSDLPSPEQLTILITLLGSLKDTLFFRYGRREKLMSPLPAAFSALLVITLLRSVLQFLSSTFN
jgi:hypothetical protein